MYNFRDRSIGGSGQVSGITDKSINKEKQNDAWPRGEEMIRRIASIISSGNKRIYRRTKILGSLSMEMKNDYFLTMRSVVTYAAETWSSKERRRKGDCWFLNGKP